MASFTGSFTAAGQVSQSIPIRPGQSLTYTLETTFTGAIHLELAGKSGLSWSTFRTITDEQAATTYHNDSLVIKTFRFRVVSFTGTTTTWTLADTSGDPLQEAFDEDGTRLYYVDDGGYMRARGYKNFAGTEIGAGAGTGDVVGPASSVDGEIALFDGATGVLLKSLTGTGLVKATSGVASVATLVNADVSATAAIAWSKMAALTEAHILVGNASGVAVDVAVSGDITISNAGVVAIASGVIVNDDINASAGIARSKFAVGTASHVLINDGSGVMSSEATLAISRGGTGQATAQAAIDALLPSQTGNSGKYLTTDGTNCSWASVAGGGIGGSTGSTDNAILRADGTGGSTAQSSLPTIADTTGAITLPNHADAGIRFAADGVGNIGMEPSDAVGTNRPLGLGAKRIMRVGGSFYILDTGTAQITMRLNTTGFEMTTDTGSIYLRASSTDRVQFYMADGSLLLSTSGSQFRTAYGTAAKPNFAAVSDYQSGFYVSAANTVGISTNQTARLLIGSDGIVNCTNGGIRTKVSTANTANPPTDAELDSAFGTPATVGSGFVGILDDADGGTNVYICFTEGSVWLTALGTVAA